MAFSSSRFSMSFFAIHSLASHFHSLRHFWEKVRAANPPKGFGLFACASCPAYSELFTEDRSLWTKFVWGHRMHRIRRNLYLRYNILVIVEWLATQFFPALRCGLWIDWWNETGCCLRPLLWFHSLCAIATGGAGFEQQSQVPVSKILTGQSVSQKYEIWAFSLAWMTLCEVIFGESRFAPLLAALGDLPSRWQASNVRIAPCENDGHSAPLSRWCPRHCRKALEKVRRQLYGVHKAHTVALLIDSAKVVWWFWETPAW